MKTDLAAMVTIFSGFKFFFCRHGIYVSSLLAAKNNADVPGHVKNKTRSDISYLGLHILFLGTLSAPDGGKDHSRQSNGYDIFKI